MVSQAELILRVITLWFLDLSHFFRDSMGHFKLLAITSESNWTRKQDYKLAKQLSCMFFFTKICLITLYGPVFQSNLDYCLTVWCHCANKCIKQLQKLQNRLARVITNNFNRDVSSCHIINTLGWMSVKQRFEYLMGCFMYKCLNNDNHNSVIPSFNFISNVHLYNSRLHASNSNSSYPKRNILAFFVTSFFWHMK